MNTIRQPTECLLSYFIDKDIQAPLRPFNILRKIFLLENFTIITNFITPIYAVFHVKPVIGALILQTICFYRFLIDRNFPDGFDYPIVSSVIHCIDLIHDVVSCALLHIVNVMQTNNFVLLIVKVQHVLNTINPNRERTMLSLKLWNWIYISSIIIFYFFIFQLRHYSCI